MAGEARELPGSWFWRGAGEFEPTRCWTWYGAVGYGGAARCRLVACDIRRTMIQSRRLGPG